VIESILFTTLYQLPNSYGVTW